jgi:hypothetical protein
MLRAIVVPTIVVIAVVIALVSISYPSVVVSSISTQPLVVFGAYTSRYEVGYPQATVSTVLAGYSSMTAWYPGNPICDPASNACTPYPTPTATLVYPQSMTYTFQVTLSSQTASTYTSGFTLFSLQTSYQNVPPYAAAGLTEFQYGIVAMAIVVVVVLSLLIIFSKKRNQVVSPNRTWKLDSAKTFRFCQQCGTVNPVKGRFCTNCGTRLV